MDMENVAVWTLEEEYQKNTYLKMDDVATLRNFCSSIPSSAFFNITDELMVATLHSNNYNLDESLEAITSYFETRVHSPEVFNNREVDSEGVICGLEHIYFCPLPRRSPEGYRIILQKMRRLELQGFNYTDIAKFEFLTIDCLWNEEPACPGYVIAYDMRGISMGHILKSNLLLARKLLRYTQVGSPMKIQRIAVLYASNLSEKIFTFAKQFMRKRISDTIKMYTADEMGEFWECFPKEYWPLDFDGELPEIETLHQDQIKWLRRMQPKVDEPNTST